MTTILLTRHGHVEGIAPARFRGRAELALSTLGQHQAEALARRVAKKYQTDVIYTSPLSRCVHTGDAIARAIHDHAQTHDQTYIQAQALTLTELADIDYGQWQGLTHDNVRARWPEEFRLWLEAPELAIIPDGETLAAVLVRATAVLQLVLRKHKDQTVLLVGHDSINRIILLHSLGLPLSHYWRIKQDPCCLNELAVNGATFTIHSINDSYHLADVRG